MAKTFDYTVVERMGIVASIELRCPDEEALTAEVQALQRAGWTIASTAVVYRTQGPPWRLSRTLQVLYYLKRPQENLPHRIASRKR